MNRQVEDTEKVCVLNHDTCSCYKDGKCVRKSNNSDEVGVCWMTPGQGEY